MVAKPNHARLRRAGQTDFELPSKATRKRPFVESTRKYFHTTHYKTVARSGGVRTAELG